MESEQHRNSVTLRLCVDVVADLFCDLLWRTFPPPARHTRDDEYRSELVNVDVQKFWSVASVKPYISLVNVDVQEFWLVANVKPYVSDGSS